MCRDRIFDYLYAPPTIGITHCGVYKHHRDDDNQIFGDDYSSRHNSPLPQDGKEGGEGGEWRKGKKERKDLTEKKSRGGTF